MKKQMTEKLNTNKGITLIALVITIIVMLILVAVTISMAVNGGLFEYAGNAGKKTNNAIREEQQLASGQITVDNKVYNSIDEYLNGGSLTLGDVYTDDMIGQPITYSANEQEDWIVFGKDKNGNILITTELPIDEAFELYGSAEKWLTYEDDLHTACAGYGGTIQGQEVTSRSITMEDINYVVGLTKPTLEKFTFGSTLGWNSETEKWDSNNVNYYYPSTEASDNSFWQDPKSIPGTFEVGRYCVYFNTWDGEYYYYERGTDWWEEVPASDKNIKTNNCKYIWGGNSDETMYNKYLVASRAVDVSCHPDAQFLYYSVEWSGVCVDTEYNTMIYSTSDFYTIWEDEDLGVHGIRPVVVLPSNLLVEEQSGGTYDLSK